MSYYPTLSMTGSAGGSSDELAKILSNPVASIAGAIAFPFLQANEMKLAVQVSEADYELAALNFRQTLITAYAEVENALSQRTQYAAQGEEMLAVLEQAKIAEGLYEVRYRAGALPLRDWLDAQDRRREAELNIAENEFNQLSATVTLILALGGDPQTQLE